MAHKVKIGLKNNTPSAHPDPCIICSDCSIVWVAGDGVKEFEVKFDKKDAPFSGTIYRGKPGEPAWSSACKVRPGSGTKQNFKYTLTVNGASLDPSVEVDGGP